jgi:hypothetical protein
VAEARSHMQFGTKRCMLSRRKTFGTRGSIVSIIYENWKFQAGGCSGAGGPHFETGLDLDVPQLVVDGI